MGMLDQVLGSVLQAAGGAGPQQKQQSDILGGLMGVINSPQVGGLGGLVKGFEKSGLGDLVGKWVAVGPNPAPTAKQVQQGLGGDTIANLAKQLGINPAQLTSQHVALWRELPLQRARPAYTNGCITLLVAAFRLGAECGQCQPLTLGRLPMGRRERVLLPDEYRRIRAAACEWMRIAMDLGYLTGARPSDLRALRWENVGERLAVRQIKTQTRQEFTLQGDIATVLQQARQRPILGLCVVANAKGRPISRNAWSEEWVRARSVAGVPDAQFRDIRVMAARQAEADGLDYQALLGHTTRKMSDRYLKGRRTVVAEPVRKRL